VQYEPVIHGERPELVLDDTVEVRTRVRRLPITQEQALYGLMVDAAV
jgi:hypothetical protein